MTITAVLGVGKIGGALLGGLIASGTDPGELRMVEQGHHASALAKEYGVTAATAAGAAEVAGVLVLAVKPVDVAALLDQLSAHVDPQRHLIVSVAAGVTTSSMQARLPAGTPVVRAMPNTPVLVREGMTAISAGSHAEAAHLDIAEAVFSAVGRVLRVPESSLDAVTALSGTGPAYFYLIAEVLADAGVLLGLQKSVALELIAQTALGAAMLLRDSGDSPAVLRDAVSSPAGTTVAGIRELEERGVRAAFIAAAEAARDRSRALAAELQ